MDRKLSKRVSEGWTKKSTLLLERAVSASKRSLGYVVGAVASDGCIVLPKRGTGNRIEISTVNRSFAVFCFERMREVFGEKVRIYSKKPSNATKPTSGGFLIITKAPLVWKIELCDKLVPSFVDSLMRPAFLADADDEFKIGFLQGLYDGDGYVKRRLDRRAFNSKTGKMYKCQRSYLDGVGLTSGWKDALFATKKILSGFGIKSSITPVTKKRTCGRVMIYSKDGMKRFANLIGFRVDYRAERLACGIKEMSA